MYKNEHSQKRETKLFFNIRIVVYSYIGILCSYENEQILTKYNNMDESHKHLIEQRKSEAKRPQTT